MANANTGNTRVMVMAAALALLLGGLVGGWLLMTPEAPPTPADATVKTEAPQATAATVVRTEHNDQAEPAAAEMPKLPPSQLPRLNVPQTGHLTDIEFGEGMPASLGMTAVSFLHVAVTGCLLHAKATNPDGDIWLRIRATLGPDAAGAVSVRAVEVSPSPGAEATMADCARKNLLSRKLSLPKEAAGTIAVTLRPMQQGMRRPVIGPGGNGAGAPPAAEPAVPTAPPSAPSAEPTPAPDPAQAPR